MSSKYRVTCVLRSDKNLGRTFPVSEIDRHPDIAKQKILSKYPKHTMENIRIEDLSESRRAWDDEIITKKV